MPYDQCSSIINMGVESNIDNLSFKAELTVYQKIKQTEFQIFLLCSTL